MAPEIERIKYGYTLNENIVGTMSPMMIDTTKNTRENEKKTEVKEKNTRKAQQLSTSLVIPVGIAFLPSGIANFPDNWPFIVISAVILIPTSIIMYNRI